MRSERTSAKFSLGGLLVSEGFVTRGPKVSVSLTEYEKALDSLKEALRFASSSLSLEDAVLFKIARDACIQRFEYCIELSWRVSVKKLGSTTKFAKPARWPERD